MGAYVKAKRVPRAAENTLGSGSSRTNRPVTRERASCFDCWLLKVVRYQGYRLTSSGHFYVRDLQNSEESLWCGAGGRLGT